jgi:acylaminoacyl-peptidase
MSGVDAIIARGSIDPGRLFVTGGSGGGILTAWVVGKTGRFAAAVAQKPVINWYSFALTSDGYNYFSDYWFSGPPWQTAQTPDYLARSPLSLVGNVTTPTMLLTGEQDYRTPMSESEQFYQALRLCKVDSMLIRIPGASHAIVARPSRMMVKVAHILKWFERYDSSRP